MAGASVSPWAIGAQVAGSAIQGVAAGQQAKEDAKNKARQLAEQQRQFNAQFGENQRQYGADYKQKAFDQNLSATAQMGDRAQGVNRELELMPMRDKAAALMMQRMGAGPQQMTPRSLDSGTNGLRGPAPAMPYDLNAQAAQAAAYKPGDGGMTGSIQKQLLARYMDVPQAPQLDAASAGPNLNDVESKVAAMLDTWKRLGVPVGERERVGNQYRMQLMSGNDPYATKGV